VSKDDCIKAACPLDVSRQLGHVAPDIYLIGAPVKNRTFLREFSQLIDITRFSFNFI
jgi:hypothetical protein